MMMLSVGKILCKDCKHFRIKWEPQKIGGQCVDWGQAECKKHNLVTDFKTHGKFERLSCVEEEKEGEDEMRLRIVDIDECDKKRFFKDCGGKDSLITVEAAFDMLEALPTAKVIENIKAEINTGQSYSGTDVIAIIDKHIGEVKE